MIHQQYYYQDSKLSHQVEKISSSAILHILYKSEIVVNFTKNTVKYWLRGTLDLV